MPQDFHLEKLEEHFGLPFKTLVDRYLALGPRRKIFERWNAEADAWPIQLGPHRLRLDEDGDLFVNDTTVILNPQREGGKASG